MALMAVTNELQIFKNLHSAFFSFICKFRQKQIHKIDSRTGEGTYWFHTGDVYRGEFVNNEFDGQGRYTSADGQTYEGAYVNSAKQGQVSILE
jgi:hypothetical protein